MIKTTTAITNTNGELRDSEFCRRYWNEKGTDELLGARIMKVEYMSKEESDEMMWDEQPICLLLKKGNQTFWMFPSQDDEGNNGGALFYGKDGVMPTLRER